MGKHRRYSTDRNHGLIVRALRAAGADVYNTAMVGDGFLDVVVGFRGRTTLLEIKDEGGELEDSQAKFLATWRGGPAGVAYTVEQAFAVCGIPAIVASSPAFKVAALAPGEKKTAKARASQRAKASVVVKDTLGHVLRTEEVTREQLLAMYGENPSTHCVHGQRLEDCTTCADLGRYR